MFYRINESTLLIKRQGVSEKRTKIIEVDNIIYIDEEPLKIINQNCTSSGASLEGRNATVSYILNSKTNLPIPIHLHKGIYMFPTISTSNDDCIWISYFHIFKYEPLGNKSIITFHNGEQLLIDLSFNRLDTQVKRTSQVIAYFYRLLHFPNFTLQPEKT